MDFKPLDWLHSHKGKVLYNYPQESIKALLKHDLPLIKGD